LNTEIQTFQVWLEEFKLEKLEFKQLFHIPHLQKRKGGGRGEYQSETRGEKQQG